MSDISPALLKTGDSQNIGGALLTVHSLKLSLSFTLAVTGVKRAALNGSPMLFVVEGGRGCLEDVEAFN